MSDSGLYINKKDNKNSIEKLRVALAESDAVIVGAGAGLSTSAGYIYGGQIFWDHFTDFYEKYGFSDMYSGGFADYDSLEDKWGFWCRMIWLTRFVDEKRPVYRNLFELLYDKNYFVITTNGDHCFQKAGFDKNRLFYTQGDMGLIQCSKPCHDKTYDNEEIVKQMLKSQGYEISENNELIPPVGTKPRMKIATKLIPLCPKCGRPMEMNLRGDDRFVEDDGWHAACSRYESFVKKYKNAHVLYLELGVGFNTPSIIKFPFWQLTAQNKNAIYSCINYGQANCPDEIAAQSICIDDDIGDVLAQLS